MQNGIGMKGGGAYALPSTQSTPCHIVPEDFPHEGKVFLGRHEHKDTHCNSPPSCQVIRDNAHRAQVEERVKYLCMAVKCSYGMQFQGQK